MAARRCPAVHPRLRAGGRYRRRAASCVAPPDEIVVAADGRGGRRGMTWRASILTLFPDMFPARSASRWPAGRWRRRLVAGCRRTSATSPPTGTAPSTTRRSAAAPAWCCGRTWSTRRSTSVADDRPLVCLTPRGRRFDAGRRAAPRRRAGRRAAVRPLRGHRPARDRGARHARSQHRRLRAVGRRTRRRWCCWTPACGCCPA